MKIYAIYDTVAEEIVGRVFGAAADAAAVRLFTDLLSDKQTAQGTHPTDYNLLRVAEITNGGALYIPDDAKGIPTAAREAFHNATSTTPPTLILTGAAWLAATQPRLSEKD